MPRQGSGGVFQGMVCKTPASESAGKRITNVDSWALVKEKFIQTCVNNGEEDFIQGGRGYVTTTMGILQ